MNKKNYLKNTLLFHISIRFFQNKILNFKLIFYPIIQISLSHPAANASYTVEWVMLSLWYFDYV